MSDLTDGSTLRCAPGVHAIDVAKHNRQRLIGTLSPSVMAPKTWLSAAWEVAIVGVLAIVLTSAAVSVADLRRDMLAARAAVERCR